MTHYWHSIEKQWIEDHSRDLTSFLSITEATHAFVASVAQSPDFVSRPVSAVTTVERLLIRRLGEELRGVELLAANSHGFQAISAAANLFEQSHFLTYASSTVQVAQKYLETDDPKKGIASVKDVVTASGKLRGWDSLRIDEEYAKYSLLCGFKHNNGFMQRVLKLPRDPDLVLGQLAISDSVWFVLTTMGLLTVTSLPAKASTPFLVECNRLLDVFNGLPRIRIS